jgi:hypothetical protein
MNIQPTEIIQSEQGFKVIIYRSDKYGGNLTQEELRNLIPPRSLNRWESMPKFNISKRHYHYRRFNEMITEFWDNK